MEYLLRYPIPGYRLAYAEHVAVELEGFGAFEVAVHANADAAGGVVDLAAVPALLFGVVFEAPDENHLAHGSAAEALVGVLDVQGDASVGLVRIRQPIDLGSVGAVGGFGEIHFVGVFAGAGQILAKDVVRLFILGGEAADCQQQRRSHGEELFHLIISIKRSG